MSWPERLFRNGKWQPYQQPKQRRHTYGIDKGLPDDWWSQRSTIKRSNFWEVLDNPLYEAAAGANDIDWERFKKKALSKVGTEEEYNLNTRIPAEGWFQDEETGLWGEEVTSIPALSGTINPLGGGWQEEPEWVNTYDQGYGAALDAQEDPLRSLWHKEDDKDLTDWGISRNQFGTITEDLDLMQNWLTEIHDTASRQDMPIIEEGPRGSDYGIEGDIWEYYGLDEPPKPPERMDWNSVDKHPNFGTAVAVRSEAKAKSLNSYSPVRPGQQQYPEINLHGE